MVKIPILIMAFNRPDYVKLALEPVKTYQPDRLYLACDGPRRNRDDEAALVSETQKTMLDAVNWKCEVKTLFRESNLGCAQGVYQAVSWFFENEEYGIIIEDDVILGQDFFKLCEVLLPRYANNERIMQIGAQNYSNRKDIPNSYVYTQTIHCWGWATWRRAWVMMDMSMSAVKDLSLNYLLKRLGCLRGLMWFYYFKSAYHNLNRLNTWDTEWYLSILMSDGLIICPGVNLAINIGMDGGAHYEKGDKDPYEDLMIESITWPLVYNDSQKIDKRQSWYDKKDFRKVRTIGLIKKLKNIIIFGGK